MAWLPISFVPTQYSDTTGVPYSGAVLKMYAEGTTTPISMATDSTGATTAATFALNAAGYPVSGGAVIIPHVEQNFKSALYPTQAAADANSGAIWTVDNNKIAVLSITSSVTAAQGDSDTSIATTEWVGQNFQGGGVNAFRNASMDVWQRGTSALNATTAGDYTADGWIVTPSGATVVVARDTGITSGRALYCMKITGAASVTGLVVKQRIESYTAASKLAGKRCTVQAYVKNSTGGAVVPTLTIKYPTAQDNYAGTTTFVNAVSLQSCPDGTWTKIAYTFDADASCSNGMEVSFDFGNNFSTTSDILRLTEFDIRFTPGVTTGQNNAAPYTEMLNIDANLNWCMRFYQAASGIAWAGCIANTNDTSRHVSFPWPSGQMRAAPTCVGTWSAGSGSVISTTVYGVQVASSVGDTTSAANLTAFTATAEL